MKLLTSAVTMLNLSLMLALMGGCQKSEPLAIKPQKGPHLVEVAEVQHSVFGLFTPHTGTLRAMREIQIYSQEAGRIVALPFHEGDQVTEGQVLARLDDALLQASLTKAQASLTQIKQEYERLQALYKRQLVSDEMLQAKQTAMAVAQADLEVLQVRLGYTVLRSPMTGVISQRLSEAGNIAEQYTHLLTVSDPSSLITEVSVSELLIANLGLHTPVKVTIDALGEQEFSGHVARIYPNIDPITRRGTLEVTLEPVPEGARPGQLCRVTFVTQQALKLAIPFRALRRDEHGIYVFLLADQNRVARRAVTSGLRFDDQVEITHGLAAGERVITRGFQGLNDGKQVELIQAGAPPQ